MDLELATRPLPWLATCAAKAEAGFKMYAPRIRLGRLSAVLDEREITAEIFSL